MLACSSSDNSWKLTFAISISHHHLGSLVWKEMLFTHGSPTYVHRRPLPLWMRCISIGRKPWTYLADLGKLHSWPCIGHTQKIVVAPKAYRGINPTFWSTYDAPGPLVWSLACPWATVIILASHLDLVSTTTWTDDQCTWWQYRSLWNDNRWLYLGCHLNHKYPDTTLRVVSACWWWYLLGLWWWDRPCRLGGLDAVPPRWKVHGSWCLEQTNRGGFILHEHLYGWVSTNALLRWWTQFAIGI